MRLNINLLLNYFICGINFKVYGRDIKVRLVLGVRPCYEFMLSIVSSEINVGQA